MDEMTSVYAEITKTAPQADGSLMVYGKATDSTLDLDGQMCDSEWLSRAMPEWFTAGNGAIREQHDSHRAVGKAVEHEAKDGVHWIKAKIVDPVAKAKTEAGIFSGFSIGIKSPRIVKDASAPNGKIVDGRVIECSLVDVPCNPNATLTLCKAAKPGMEVMASDLDEERGLVKCEELVEKTVVVDSPVEDATGAVKTPAPSPLNMPGAVKSTETRNVVADDSTEPAEKLPAENGAPAEEFDRDAAKALVAEVLTKADGDGLGQNESGDISGAEQAIQTVAQLIISEAQALANMPAQDCDIQLLMQAVNALRAFSNREKLEGQAIDPDGNMVTLAAEADTVKAKYSADDLRQMLKDGKAMKNPNGDPSYPIGDEEDLKNAIHAVGRGSGDHSDIRSFIKRRAKAMGKVSMLPDSWNDAGLDLAADADTLKISEPEAVEPDASEPDTTKATDVAPDPDALVKALTNALEKADSPLRKQFTSIVEASTEATAKSVTELTERLAKVEQMAVPGGPALRRTEADRNLARKNDLLSEAARYKTLAMQAGDPDLHKGYSQKARELEMQVKAL